MKIGVYLPMYGTMICGVRTDPDPSFTHAKRVARLSEEMGLRHPTICSTPSIGEEAKALEAWMVITALAAVTNRTKLAHTVLCQAFRPPAVLAKMVTTLDDVCQGRFIFSIGAGWYKREFEAYGLLWDDHVCLALPSHHRE